MNSREQLIFTLLVVFQFKHFFADYPLQTPYMLQKFKVEGWVKPLAAHAGVHMFFTFVISVWALFYTPGGLAYALGLSLLDFVIHFFMDRIKASPKLLGRYESLSKDQFKGLVEARRLAVMAHDAFMLDAFKKEVFSQALAEIKKIDLKFLGNKYFWWALGVDQKVHHLTHYLIIYLIMKVVVLP